MLRGTDAMNALKLYCAMWPQESSVSERAAVTLCWLSCLDFSLFQVFFLLLINWLQRFRVTQYTGYVMLLLGDGGAAFLLNC